MKLKLSPTLLSAILTLLATKAREATASAGEVTLNIGSFLSLSEHWWSKYGHFYVKLLESTFEEINNRTDIIPGYKLKLIPRDTQGLAGQGAKVMAELLSEDPPKIAILGAGLSAELEVIGQMAQFYNLPLLSFAASTSHPLDRDIYKSVFMTNYLGESVIPARLAIMRAFHWTHVATIVYKDQVFETEITEFHSTLKMNNFTLVTSAIITDLTQTYEHVVRLKQYDARIIMGSFRSTHAPYIFCEAYKHGLYGNAYQWILTGASMYDGWIGRFFREHPDELDCTMDEVVEASKNYMAIDNIYLRPDEDTVTMSGKTAAEYSDMVKAMDEDSPYVPSRTHPYGYDAAWALALALNCTQKKLESGVLGNTTYEDYNNTRQDMFDVLLASLKKVSFEGVSGYVSFTEKGRRLGPHQISQNNNDTKIIVGLIDRDSELTWKVPESLLFEAGRPPRDRYSYVTKVLPADPAAVAVMMVVNTAGLVIGVGFLIFNIVYRNNRHIKMSSPNINNIIVLGCLFMYIFVYILTSDYASWACGTTYKFCMVRTWLACIGFTLSFGALFSKTWRVHALFRNKEMKRKVIKDPLLLTHVAILVLIDMVILIPWTAIYPLDKKQYSLPPKSESVEDNVLVTYTYKGCAHEYEIYWYMAEYIYKGMLLAFGAFLAWETRMVNIPALNDSKLIGFCIYNIAIVCAFVVPVTHVLGEEKTTLTFLLVGLFVSLCTSLVLCILFIPKVRLRNHVTDRRFVTSLNTQQGITKTELSNNHKELLQLPTPSNGDKRSISSKLNLLEENNSASGVFTVDKLSFIANSTETLVTRDINDVDKEKKQEQEQQLQDEVKRLNMKLAEEMKAITKLKSSLLKESNNQLNFHKIGQDYIVFKSTPTPTPTPTSPNGTAPEEERECGESET